MSSQVGYGIPRISCMLLGEVFQDDAITLLYKNYVLLNVCYVVTAKYGID